MTQWRPSGSVAAARRRAALKQRIRDYFSTQNVLEVDTPALNAYAVTDTQIESLRVDSVLCDSPLYLHTSPEFAMKRLLAAGYPDCYSIAHVFRDGEAGRKHQPEFTMVEWYRLGMTLNDIVQDTVELITRALQQEDLHRDVVHLSYCDAFAMHVGIDPLSAPVETLNTIANRGGSEVNLGEERNDWLDCIFATQVCPQFAKSRLTVVQHYPADQAALARICPQDAAVADRFEVFHGEVELANGYVELTDADELQRRMTADQATRERRGKTQPPQDRALLASMQHGLPACAGVAMGLERLQMVQDDCDNIGDVITFPYHNESATQ